MFLPVGFGPEVHVNLSKLSFFLKGLPAYAAKVTLSCWHFYSRDYTYVRGLAMLLYNQIKLFVSCLCRPLRSVPPQDLDNRPPALISRSKTVGRNIFARLVVWTLSKHFQHDSPVPRATILGSGVAVIWTAEGLLDIIHTPKSRLIDC